MFLSYFFCYSCAMMPETVNKSEGRLDCENTDWYSSAAPERAFCGLNCQNSLDGQGGCGHAFDLTAHS